MLWVDGLMGQLLPVFGNLRFNASTLTTGQG